MTPVTTAMFLESENDTIMYYIVYPNKGKLQFHILGLRDDRIELCWDEGRRSVTLKECTEKELWDKMSYLLEGI